MTRRWRFVHDCDGTPRERRVIEVEVEQVDGFNLTTGQPWSGIEVKARHPLLRDRRWKRANVIGHVQGHEREEAEIVAVNLLGA